MLVVNLLLLSGLLMVGSVLAGCIMQTKKPPVDVESKLKKRYNGKTINWK